MKRVDGFVLHLDESLDGYDLNGGAGEESKGSVRPRDGIVQVRVRLGTAVNHAPVCKHQLVRLANVLKRKCETNGTIGCCNVETDSGDSCGPTWVKEGG